MVSICIYLISGVNIFPHRYRGIPSCYQINTLPDTWFLSIFSQSVGCLPSVDGGLCGAVISFDAGLIGYFCYCLCSGVIFMKSLPRVIHFPYFFS